MYEGLFYLGQQDCSLFRNPKVPTTKYRYLSGLKPRTPQHGCGMAEAMPLSKTKAHLSFAQRANALLKGTASAVQFHDILYTLSPDILYRFMPV